jgi:4-hydroxy-4-methyl-2-oxoglutarate aldolase
VLKRARIVVDVRPVRGVEDLLHRRRSDEVHSFPISNHEVAGLVPFPGLPKSIKSPPTEAVGCIINGCQEAKVRILVKREIITVSTIKLSVVIVLALALVFPASAQIGMFSKEQLAAITKDWQGSRDEGGRPLVPDSVLKRLKNTSAEEAWGVLRGAGYSLQFEGDWQGVNIRKDDRLVGRVVTAVFTPMRRDLNDYINESAKKEGRVGRGQNSWPIDMLKPGDVLVVDLFGKIKDGTFMGDNLATSIFAKSGTGIVINGALRDLSGITEIKGIKVYVRGFDPSAIGGVTLSGINVPIRIGGTTVVPGDVVLGDPEGVTFIPAHLAEKVADSSEETQLRDEWGHAMLREGKYTPGQIDAGWTEQMQAEYKKYAAEQRAKRR